MVGVESFRELVRVVGLVSAPLRSQLTCLMSGTDPLSARARAPTGRLELLSDEDTDDEYFMQDEASTSSGSSGVEAEHDDAAPEPESEPAPLSNDNVDDITMDYASGSVIFSVQGVRFKVGNLSEIWA